VKYFHFEALTLVLGTGAIIASIFVSPATSPQAVEVAGQLLLIVVIAGAIHWGRNGGFIAALLSIAIYVAMRVPLLQSQGLSTDVVTLLATRSITYALVGIVGGEIAGRIKYVFARLSSDTLIDPVTGVYSARYAADAIASGLGQWQRYQTHYSVVVITLARSVYAALKANRSRQLLRQAASHIRNDIRMVDDLASGGTGTYYILLPRTDAPGAAVVAERLSLGLREMLGTRDDSVTAAVLSAERDAQTLNHLVEKLNPTVAEIPPAATPTGDLRGASADRRQDPVA